MQAVLWPSGHAFERSCGAFAPQVQESEPTPGCVQQIDQRAFSRPEQVLKVSAEREPDTRCRQKVFAMDLSETAVRQIELDFRTDRPRVGGEFQAEHDARAHPG